MTHNIRHFLRASLTLSLLSLALLMTPADSSAKNNKYRGNNNVAVHHSNKKEHNKNKGYRPNRPAKPNRPGSSVQRPGNGNHRPGTSVTRPGHPTHNSPTYRPPRPGGGYWGKPALPPHRWRRPVFAVPVRPVRVVTGVPTIGSVLGLAFGTLVDYGINTLYSSGYNVLGYENNAVYLSNVMQLGYSWPYVTVNYVNGRMNNTQFQYWSPRYDTARFDRIYSSLCSTYGAPIQSSTNYGVSTFTWWGGSNTGYVTLQFGQGDAYNGGSQYYTNLIYGSAN